MKKYILSALAFFAVALCTTAFGQGEGHISYEIADVKSDNPQMQAQLEMMKGSTTDVYYKGNKSLTNMNMMGGMVNVNLIKEEGKDFQMAMDMMGQKMLIPISKEEQEKMEAENDNPLSELTITYDESDTKEIAGFNCYKMVATPVTNPDMKIEAYITEEIKTTAALIQGVDMEQFKGYPLEIVANMGPMILTTRATAYEAKCEDSSLNLDTTGYTEMSFEDFMNSMGQMGGGFGF